MKNKTDTSEWVGHNRGHNKQTGLVDGRKRTNQHKEGTIGIGTKNKWVVSIPVSTAANFYEKINENEKINKNEKIKQGFN